MHRYTDGIPSPDGDTWRQDLLEAVLGDPNKVIAQFASEPKTGMIGAKHWIRDDIGKNATNILNLSRRLNLWTEVKFVAGSMFWVRGTILKQFFANNSFTTSELETESARDGKMCHAFERIFGMCVLQAGYSIEGIGTSEREQQLRKEIDSLGPWVTSFVIEGRRYGGHYHPDADTRLIHFRREFPDVKTILELGSLEGGHSLILSKWCESIHAVEGREENVKRSKWLLGRLGVRNVCVWHENLEEVGDWSARDVCFCVGILYHLPKPWELLRKIRKSCNSLFLWTHFSKESATEKGGYKGSMYVEHGYQDSLSGLSKESFWPTHEELLRMLSDCGFVDVKQIDVGENSVLLRAN